MQDDYYVTEPSTANERSKVKITKKYITRAKKSRPNHVGMGFDDEGLLLWAERKKKRIRKKELMIMFEGGMSEEQAIRCLRLVIGHLEKEGLPREPGQDFIHMESLLLATRKKGSAAGTGPALPAGLSARTRSVRKAG